MIILEDDQEDQDFLLTIHQQIASQRYSEPRKYSKTAASETVEKFMSYSEPSFKQEFRLTKESFEELYALLKDNPVFDRKRTNQQFSFKLQLMVFFTIYWDTRQCKVFRLPESKVWDR